MHSASGLRTVCILTAGRSGSSLATRTLGHLGLAVGTETEMYPTDRHNERGYWELRAVNSLNDDILEALGGSLWDPPPLPDGWAERNPLMEPLRQRARALVERHRAPDRRWVFKDTRTVYTLPLWRAVLGEMDYVLCVRDPGEVIASLAKLLPERSHVDLAGLWIRANCVALRETSGRRRLILRYDDWFEDPATVTRRLVDFFELDVDDSMIAQAQAEFEPSLRHERQKSGLAKRVAVPVEAQTLDVVFRRLEQQEDPAIEALAEGLDAAYCHKIRRCSSAAPTRPW